MNTTLTIPSEQGVQLDQQPRCSHSNAVQPINPLRRYPITASSLQLRYPQESLNSQTRKTEHRDLRNVRHMRTLVSEDSHQKVKKGITMRKGRQLTELQIARKPNMYQRTVSRHIIHANLSR